MTASSVQRIDRFISGKHMLISHLLFVICVYINICMDTLRTNLMIAFKQTVCTFNKLLRG